MCDTDSIDNRMVYFVGPISGDRTFVSNMKEMAACIKSFGFIVLTEHAVADYPDIVLAKNIGINKADLTPQIIRKTDIDWLNQACALIAEVSIPSHGVGVEIEHALTYGTRILCLYKRGQKVSPMILGINELNASVRSYADIEEAKILIEKFLKA